MIKSREISIPKALIGVAAVMLISVAGAGAETPTRLTDVSVSTVDALTTVVVKTGTTPKFRAMLIDPHRLVVDFDDTQYEWRRTPLPGRVDPVEEIRGSQFKRNVARIVVQLARPSAYSVEERADGVQIVLGDREARVRPAALLASRVPAATD